MRFTDLRVPVKEHGLFEEMVNHMLDAGWQLASAVRVDDIRGEGQYYACSMLLQAKPQQSFGLFPMSSQLAKLVTRDEVAKARLIALGVKVDELLEEYRRGEIDDSYTVPSNSS